MNNETLREFREKFCCREENCCNGRNLNDHYSGKEIADWWLSKFSSHNKSLIEKIEGMKFTEDDLALFRGTKDYNQAIEDTLSLIKNQSI